MQVFRDVFEKNSDVSLSMHSIAGGLSPRRFAFLKKNRHARVTFPFVVRHYIMSSDSFHKKILPLKDKLFRLAYGIAREQAEAEDVLQDVLVKLWSRRTEWDEIENLEAYCFRSVKNMALDRIAAKALRKTDAIDPENEVFYFVEHRSPHHDMVQKEQREMIEKCIDELSENQRLVFQLREMEGMSYREIAESLAISEDLVKVSLFRARKKMQDLLSGFRDSGAW